MYAGRPHLCLKSKHMDASRRFYEALGFSVVDEVGGLRIVLERGSFNLALMSFLDEDSLNLRGADAFAIRDHLRQQGISAEGEPERYVKEKYNADADGACWLTRDPDGHSVIFDTNQTEQGPEAMRQRIDRVLRNAEQDLIDAGANAECLEAYRVNVLVPFTSEIR